MKRFIATILAVIYFTASTGATVNIHYCMGKLQSMDLWQSPVKKKVCSKCGMANKKGCCEDKHEVVKLEKKYNIPVTGFSIAKIINYTGHSYSTAQILIKSGKIVRYSSSNSPPGTGDSPLFIRNCVFRI